MDADHGQCAVCERNLPYYRHITLGTGDHSHLDTVHLCKDCWLANEELINKATGLADFGLDSELLWDELRKGKD